MNLPALQAALRDLPLGGLRFYESVASTNEAAAAWAADGAADFSVVVADEQTAGRGRAGRAWFTPPKSALAFSLILRPSQLSALETGRTSGMGALGVCAACEGLGLEPSIKWPNDVLLHGRKVAGVLVESTWLGDQLQAAIVGIGVNVAPKSVPSPAGLAFPATCLEDEAGHALDRLDLIRRMLEAVSSWRGRMDQDEFLEAWQNRLAFRGQRVTISDAGKPILAGTLLGLDADGSARLQTNHKIVAVQVGDISLRPADDRMR